MTMRGSGPLGSTRQQPSLKWKVVAGAAAVGCLILLVSRVFSSGQAGQLGTQVVQKPDGVAGAVDPASFTQNRLVYIPDLHGDYQQAVSVLTMMGLISKYGAWAGGTAVLVQGGDMMDRGPGSLAVLRLLGRLAGQAELVGGQVILLLGNHELMLLQEDFRYFSREELRVIGQVNETVDIHGDPREVAAVHMVHGRDRLREMLGPEGPLGRELRALPVAAAVRRGNCQWLVVHAAALPWMVDQAMGLGTFLSLDARARGDAIVAHWNEVVREELAACVGRECGRTTGGLAGKLLGGEGLLWSRYYTRRTEQEVCSAVSKVASKLGVTRILVGHTIQEAGLAASLCGGLLVMADIGMSSAYGGQLGQGVAVQCSLQAVGPGELGDVHVAVEGGTPGPITRPVEDMAEAGSAGLGSAAGQVPTVAETVVVYGDGVDQKPRMQVLMT